jgi:hypothetical protein
MPFVASHGLEQALGSVFRPHLGALWVPGQGPWAWPPRP